MAGVREKAAVISLNKLTNHFANLRYRREVSDMPQGDRTGPQGQGPKTGRGMGKCGPKGGDPAPQGQGGMGTGQGQGRGAGRGAGRGKGQGAGRGTGRSGGQGRGKGRGRRS